MKGEKWGRSSYFVPWHHPAWPPIALAKPRAFPRLPGQKAAVCVTKPVHLGQNNIAQFSSDPCTIMQHTGRILSLLCMCCWVDLRQTYPQESLFVSCLMQSPMFCPGSLGQKLWKACTHFCVLDNVSDGSPAMGYKTVHIPGSASTNALSHA